MRSSSAAAGRNGMTRRYRTPQEFWDDVRAHREQAQQEFWEGLYAAHSPGERASEAAFLAAEVAGIAPGTALELGCGEGADAVWLAQQGWRVLGVDIAATAVERARARAAGLGLSDMAAFEPRDLSDDFPAGEFDLVSAQFLHSPFAAPGEREAILRRAADAVAPGGRLVVVSHIGPPSWAGALPTHVRLPTAQENRNAVDAAGGAWETVRDETVLSDVPDPEGRPGTRPDHVLHLRRISGRPVPRGRA